jgi:hypothetical protein
MYRQCNTKILLHIFSANIKHMSEFNRTNPEEILLKKEENNIRHQQFISERPGSISDFNDTSSRKRVIVQRDTDVINRIASGEILDKTSNSLSREVRLETVMQGSPSTVAMRRGLDAGSEPKEKWSGHGSQYGEPRAQNRYEGAGQIARDRSIRKAQRTSTEHGKHISSTESVFEADAAE